MKIGITLNPYGEKHPAGLAGIIYSICETLTSLPTQHQYVFFAKGHHQNRPKFLQKDSKHEFRTVAASLFWLDNMVKQNPDVDVWVFNTPMMPLLYTPKKSLVIALDFAYLSLPSHSVKEFVIKKILKQLHARALKNATHIASISEFTTKQTLHFFSKIKREKITNIMSGYKDYSQLEPAPPSFDVPDDFFLSVGVLKDRKNQLNVVRGFIAAKLKGLPSKLVISGTCRGLYGELVQQAAASSSFNHDIIFAGYVADQELATLYASARALVFPSILEGFGMPVLEAMKMGCPVITSEGNSVGEIAGVAAITVDPHSPEEIADALLQMSQDSIRQEYIQLGTKRATEFSWEKTTSAILDIINNKIK